MTPQNFRLTNRSAAWPNEVKHAKKSAADRDARPKSNFSVHERGALKGSRRGIKAFLGGNLRRMWGHVVPLTEGGYIS